MTGSNSHSKPAVSLVSITFRSNPFGFLCRGSVFVWAKVARTFSKTGEGSLTVSGKGGRLTERPTPPRLTPSPGRRGHMTLFRGCFPPHQREQGHDSSELTGVTFSHRLGREEEAVVLGERVVGGAVELAVHPSRISAQFAVKLASVSPGSAGAARRCVCRSSGAFRELSALKVSRQPRQ